jgi:hypothetical protein
MLQLGEQENLLTNQLFNLKIKKLNIFLYGVQELSFFCTQSSVPPSILYETTYSGFRPRCVPAAVFLGSLTRKNGALRAPLPGNRPSTHLFIIASR